MNLRRSPGGAFPRTGASNASGRLGWYGAEVPTLQEKHHFSGNVPQNEGLNCMQLAEDAPNFELRRIFVDVAHHWNRRAIELEDALARVDALREEMAPGRSLLGTPDSFAG
jgi:hypothetical protein